MDRSRELLKYLKDLSHHGIDTNLPVPKIVMVGDQSAGKSSLVEALTTIQVPRGEGTVTRCPLEINISDEKGPFRATVSLLQKYVWEPSTSSRRPGKWEEIHDTIFPSTFLEITEKKELADAIQKAQFAILNPTANPNDIRNLDIKEMVDPEARFSPNIVIVDIKGVGTDVPLSFIDLPGIIAGDKQGTQFPDLVKQLALGYIRDPNTLIALVISMEYDMDVSHAPQLVRSAGAQNRCIGILTKPDRLVKGSKREQWMDVLAGQEYQVKYGYYITKQPHTSQGQIDFKNARAEELSYFDRPEWKDSFQDSESRLGTEKLKVAMSDWLLDMSQKNLPEILQNIDFELQKMNDRLEHLPRRQTEPRYETETFLEEFSKAFRMLINPNNQDTADGVETNQIWSS
jgi:GTPase SAR1 family protein